MHIKIRAFNAEIRQMYQDHGHFHEGDAGLDLFVVIGQRIEPGQTVKIKLGIACENLDNKPYMLMPRSSISKTFKGSRTSMGSATVKRRSKEYEGRNANGMYSL